MLDYRLPASESPTIHSLPISYLDYFRFLYKQSSPWNGRDSPDHSRPTKAFSLLAFLA